MIHRIRLTLTGSRNDKYIYNEAQRWKHHLFEHKDFSLYCLSKEDATNVSTNTTDSLPLKVIALPLPQKPLLPGFCMPIYVKDTKLLAALEECKNTEAPYAGTFLLKDGAPSSSSKWESHGNSKKKMKQFLNRIHEIGTLAEISSIQGDTVNLIGRTRLRITDLVSVEPPTVTVDHLKVCFVLRHVVPISC
ncbi:hypothetical protein AALP_AA3G062100 [Arabis alpina]|uniref:Lon N-terminal domain-containing protein n=1 Tax=Arabis alpina TaxID=50452 RepID=A0A087H7D5_ARAAL|nr:hypothetical protein AALP_AA3G062100 [Arabis alpina]